MKEGIVLNEDIEIRKLQVALYTRGVGVTLFAIWSIIKVFLIVFTNYDGFNASVSVTPDSYSYSVSITSIAIFTVFIFGGFEATMHLLIGQKAISLSKGKRCGSFTLFLAGFFVLVSVLILTVTAFTFDGNDILDYAASYIVGLTEDILLVEVIVFSLRLKRRMR